MRDLLLKNCRVFTPAPLPGLNDILVKKGKIKEIADNLSALNIPVLDCRGLAVVPGFIDVHIQGAGGFDFLTGERQEIEKLACTVLSTGTTSFLATTEVAGDGREEHLIRLQGYIRDRAFPFARPLGIHLEGPFINYLKKGMLNPAIITKPGLSYCRRIIKHTGNTLKMMTLAPELKGSMALIRELKKNGIIAALGHTLADYEQAGKGIKAGITQVCHLFNAMTPLDHKKPGAFFAALEAQKVTVQLICDGIHIHPAVLRMAYRLFGADRICIITDGLANLGLPDGNYAYGDRRYKSINGTCYYKDGTLIGTALPLNKAAKRMQDFTGAAFEEILCMLSAVPARSLGEHNKGEIKRGKDADLVVMDKDFRIYAAIVNGAAGYLTDKVKYRRKR